MSESRIQAEFSHRSKGYPLKERAKRLSWVCAVILGASVLLTGVDAATKASRDRMVVVISLDGFPAYALGDPKLPVPTLRKLIRDGAVATSMRPVNPTVTWPNHTSIVTGVEPSEHHVLFNGMLLPSVAGA